MKRRILRTRRPLIPPDATVLSEDLDGELIVALHGMSNPRSNETLDARCEFLAVNPVNFPGTD